MNYHYCPKCFGLLPNHGLVHVRHGNGGGHNEPCPNADKETQRCLFDAVMAGKLSWGDLMDDDCPTEVEETQR